MNKKRIIVITIILILSIVLGLWISGILPKQIAKIYATNYLKNNFSNIQLEYIDIEWDASKEGYLINFKDEKSEVYTFIIKNKYFPIFFDEGLLEFKEKYEKNELANINTVTEISLGKETWIDSLTKINIKNTNDHFEITEQVKWKIPENKKATTISFSIAVPYTFIVNEESYSGVYVLGNSNSNKKIKGLKYKLEIIDLTKDGKIKIKVTK